MAKFLGTFLLILIILSPVVVFFINIDNIEGAEIPGLIVVAILLVLFFWQVNRHSSKSTKEATEEFEKNQKG